MHICWWAVAERNMTKVPSGFYTLTPSILFAKELEKQHAYASEMDKLRHDEQIVVIFNHKPHEKESLHEVGLLEDSDACQQADMASACSPATHRHCPAEPFLSDFDA